MLFGTCRRTRYILIVAILFFGAERASSETLRQVLAAKNLPVAATKLENLDKNITSGAELDDESQFLIAYYIDDGTSALNPPLYLERFDRKQGSWKNATLGKAETRWQDIDVPCLGSVMNISAIGGRYFLDTHINPSAGCVLILSREMKLESTLYGWSGASAQKRCSIIGAKFILLPCILRKSRCTIFEPGATPRGLRGFPKEVRRFSLTIRRSSY